MLTLTLTQGKVAFIDEIDADLAEVRWCTEHNTKSKTFYAKRNTGSGYVKLHRVILERILGRPLLKTEQVDHKDLNGLNNLRSNLRLATNMQNNWNSPIRCTNTSGYKGVSFDKENKRFESYITVNGKRKRLGRFPTAEDAARKYNEAAIKEYGEFSRLNILPEESSQ